MGVRRTGRVAAITNYRDPRLLKPHAPSRGRLVSSFLAGSASAKEYLREIRKKALDYNGFSLLLGEPDNLFCFSSITGETIHIEPGIHGLSNHFLNTPWPKVQRGRERLGAILEQGGHPSPDALLDLLADREHPRDELLPNTGVDVEWERLLSPVFIASPFYGTCSSTVLLVHRSGAVTFAERDCRPGPTEGREVRFQFLIEKQQETFRD